MKATLALLFSAALGPIASLSSPVALAQPLTTGRASASVAAGGGWEEARRRPTVESASREAQAAIRACDDRTAITCVAGVLTRYATTLQEIADRRAAQPGKRSGE